MIQKIDTKTSIVYGSSTYVLLCYLRMKKCAVSVDDYHKFVAGKVKPSGIARSFDVLVKYRFGRYVTGNRIVVTPLGIEYLFKIARRDNRYYNGLKSKTKTLEEDGLG